MTGEYIIHLRTGGFDVDIRRLVNGKRGAELLRAFRLIREANHGVRHKPSAVSSQT